VEVHEQISASVQAMDDMLNGLLEVSKLDMASAPLNVGPVSLEQLLNRLQLQFRAQAQEKEVALVVQTKAHDLHTDPDQLHRLLANLVSNAVRFTQRGRVLIRTRVRGPWLWIQVWDSGMGIARQDRQRIFEEFVRLPASKDVAPRGRSTGLGLSIVRRVAQRLGLYLVVRSRLGAGSMFAVRLPLERRSEVRTTSVDKSLEELLSGLLVLLIEDDPAARRSMQTLLQYCGCHVLAAQSTEDALAVVDSTLRTPDLIVSDYRLGDQDTGLDAIAKVRAVVGELIPALLMTAERTAPHEAAAYMGVPVLSKPVRATDLVDALTRLRG
jgi:CheY-like chemotaxis protein/anti-sigma regulatory factor (Ser/Thr protein kinase)